MYAARAVWSEFEKYDMSMKERSIEKNIRQSASELKRCIESGVTPILPFEKMILRGRFDSLASEQLRLGNELGEAMSQSSETWHDNAPAEAVRDQSFITANRALALQALFRDSMDVPYPSRQEDKVTLGSIVDVRYGSDLRIERYIITGVVRDIEDIEAATGVILSTEEQDVDAVTVLSPLGKNLLGTAVGDTVVYEANEKTFSLSVDQVTQFCV